MMIRQLIVTVAILTCWGGCLEMLHAQAPDTGESATKNEANKIGTAEADTGSFEATEAPEGRVGSNAEEVSKTLREMRGTGQKQQSANMKVENLNKKRDSRRRRQAQRSPPPPVHIQFRPSFGVQKTPSVQVAKSMQTRFSHLLEKRGAGVVHVVLNDRTATLTGTVKSEYERKLLERMLRIEPGVSTVENLVIVQE